VDGYRALSADDSAAVAAQPLDNVAAADASGGSMGAEGTTPAEHSAAVSTTVRASEQDGMVVVVAETDGRDVVHEISHTAELRLPQPSAGEQTGSPAAVEHDSQAAVAEQPSASEEDRQHAAANDAAAADTDNAPPAAIREPERQGPDAAVVSQAAPQTELERKAGEADASGRPSDCLEVDRLRPAVPASEPPRGAAGPSEQPCRHEDSVEAEATEPVAAVRQRTDDGADSEHVSGEDAGGEAAATGSEAVSLLQLPGLDEGFALSERAADGGAAAVPHAAPVDSATELPAAPADQVANVDHSAALAESADMPPAGDPLDGAYDASMTDAHQREPSAPEDAFLDGAVQSAQDTAVPPPPAGLETPASEAAAAVSPQQQQDVTGLDGTAASAPDRSPTLSAERAEPATEQAAVRQYVQVPDSVECHVYPIYAFHAPDRALSGFLTLYQTSFV